LAGWRDILIAFLATDGTDGPTDAAGAFADGSTVARANQLGLDAGAHLTRNDSYHFFHELGDLIMTGPTNTNVNDLVLILASR
jgi:glycerate 2-kinase